jgi:hypothetical protein
MIEKNHLRSQKQYCEFLIVGDGYAHSPANARRQTSATARETARGRLKDAAPQGMWASMRGKPACSGVVEETPMCSDVAPIWSVAGGVWRLSDRRSIEKTFLLRGKENVSSTKRICLVEIYAGAAVQLVFL